MAPFALIEFTINNSIKREEICLQIGQAKGGSTSDKI